MKHVYVEDLGKHVGEKVMLKGWLANRSSKGKLHFLQFRDGTGFVQCVVFKKDVDEDTFEQCNHIYQESSLTIEGEVREDKRAPSGVEVGVSTVKLHQLSEDYPITPKEHGVDFLLQRRHLWLRSRKQMAIMRIRSEIIRAMCDFLFERGFIRMDTPILTPAACEGTTTLFEVDYFDLGAAFLSQSGQLYNEANAMGLGKVFCFGPTFRAEKSKTRKHLNEFWMLEPEWAYAELNDLIENSSELIRYTVGRVLETRRPELAILERDTKKLENINTPFPHITFAEAVGIIREGGLEIGDKEDFGAPHEEFLGSYFGGQPVVVTHWPKDIKAFYMKRGSDDDDVVLGMDIIAPEGYGEIVGGSQREDDFDILLKRIREEGLPEEVFEWYLDLRKYGSVPHGGYGLGLERFVGWICGVDHVRECIPYPRTLNRIFP